MATTRLTKRIEFCASHRYYNDSWDEAQNRTVFGPCINEHGHNYLLEVTIQGKVDGTTGMIINLYDLKEILSDVLEEFDHRNLNLDTPYFKTKIPTTENIAWVLWTILSQRQEVGELAAIRLYETETRFAEITASSSRSSTSNSPEVCVTHRYHFTTGSQLDLARTPKAQEQQGLDEAYNANRLGATYALDVTIRGGIDPSTGRITDTPLLDHLINNQVIQRFDHQELQQDPGFQDHAPSPENLTRVIWELLVQNIPGGQLDTITLRETEGQIIEYAG